MRFFLFLVVCGLGASTWYYKTMSEDLSRTVVPAQTEGARLSEVLQKEKSQHEADLRAARSDIQALKTSLDALSREYESFKTQRRTGMVGRVLPEVCVGPDKVLTHARIMTVNAATVTFNHDGGLSRVLLKDLDDNFKWEAVWTEKEALGVEKRRTDAASLGGDKRR